MKQKWGCFSTVFSTLTKKEISLKSWQEPTGTQRPADITTTGENTKGAATGFEHNYQNRLPHQFLYSFKFRENLQFQIGQRPRAAGMNISGLIICKPSSIHGLGNKHITADQSGSAPSTLTASAAGRRSNSSAFNGRQNCFIRAERKLLFLPEHLQRECKHFRRITAIVLEVFRGSRRGNKFPSNVLLVETEFR